MTPPRILIVDDQLAKEADLRAELCEACGLLEVDTEATDEEVEARTSGVLAVAVFCSGQSGQGDKVRNDLGVAERAVTAGWPATAGWRWALVLLDLRFDSRPDQFDDETFGLRILERLVDRWPDPGRGAGNCEVPIVILSSIEKSRRGSQANRAGAEDYVEKTKLNRGRLAELIDYHGLTEDHTGQLLGRSLTLLKALRTARRVARRDEGNFLILGDKGTGKSTLARYVHAHSPRAACELHTFTVGAGMEPSVLKAHLFGFWYGAFTPADKSEAGLAERAHGSTLFIDEIANLPVLSQQELLEFARMTGSEALRRLTRLGSFPTSPPKAVEQARRSIKGDYRDETQEVLVDVFLIAATNAPIDNPEYRRRSDFREDLYDRLALETHQLVCLPSLRERPEDVIPLFLHFLQSASKRHGGVWPKRVDREIIEAVQDRAWRGNVVELMGFAAEVEKAAHAWDEILPRHLPRFARGEMGAYVVESSVAHSHGGSEHARAVAKAEQLASTNACLAHVPLLLQAVRVNGTRSELEGALRAINEAHGSLLCRLLEAALELTRQETARNRSSVLGDLHPTRAMKLLLGRSEMRTHEAADEVKRLAALFPPPPLHSDVERVITWARGLRRERGSRSARRRDE